MTSTWLKTSRFLSEIEKCIKEDLQNTEAHCLSIPAIFILNELYRQDGQRPMDLATAIGWPPTSLTPTLDKIEAAKLIKRGANKDDRRSILIYLTVAGRELQGVITAAIVNAEVRYGGR